MPTNQGNSGDPEVSNTSDTSRSSQTPQTSTKEEMMKDASVPIARSVMDNIDMTLWYKKITEDSNELHVTTLVARGISSLSTEGCTDEDLLEAYQDQFKGWNKDFFDKVEGEAKRALKALLRQGGIYTGRRNGAIGRQLADLLTTEMLPEWNPDEFEKMKFDIRSEAYRKQQALQRPKDKHLNPTLYAQNETRNHTPQQHTPKPPTQQQQPIQTIEQTTENPFIEHQPHEPQTPQGGWAQEQPHMSSTSQSLYRATPYLPYPQPIPPENEQRLSEPYNPYRTLPPRRYRNERLDANLMSTFMKMYDKTKKYTGKPYDLLDDKLKLFLDVCYHIGVKPGQFHAVFPRILTGSAEDYYISYIEQEDDFYSQYMKMKTHFDTNVNKEHYFTDWTTISFMKVRQENAEKDLHEVLQIMLNKLQRCQRALGPSYAGEEQLRTTVIKACRGVAELEHALFKPATVCEQLFADLRSSIETSLVRQQFANQLITEDDQYYLDRRYNRNDNRRKDTSTRPGNPREGFRKEFNKYNNSNRDKTYGTNRRQEWNKKCFVCNREGCWSTRHTAEERQQAKRQYLAHAEFTGGAPKSFATYLTDFEGREPEEDNFYSDEDEDDDEDHQHAVKYLTNQAFLHKMTGEDVYTATTGQPASQFLIENRYATEIFQGIIPDTGAANVSTAGKQQYLALRREDPSVSMDTTTAGSASIQFGKGNAILSVGTANVKTPIGTVTFHILDTPTPFLLCLKDMDRLRTYFDNTTNELVKDGNWRIPVVRKWGHPWFFLSKPEESGVFLTEVELRRLHRRFGHPATDRLYKLLKKAGYNDVNESIIQNIAEFCHHCQMHSPAPRRFKFALKDDREFNYEIFVDVMYLNNKPVLHVVDSSTAFHGARFLASLSAKDTWEALRTLWIDTYQGPPDIITHDAGTNFASAEFKSEAKIMGITCKQVPVEAHHSIGKVEKYHGPLRRTWDILFAELGGFTRPEAILQMALKAVNDTAGPDGLVPTLLVFGAYPRITTESPPSPSTVKRSEAIQKAMTALRKATAKRQITEALNTRNGPSTAEVLALPLQSEVCVWREHDGWQGPYKVLSIDGHNITVDMVNGPTSFRSTSVKPYCRQHPTGDEPEVQVSQHDPPVPAIEAAQPRPRGRPRGSKNKKQEGTVIETTQTRRRGRPRGSKNKKSEDATMYMTKKEEDNMALAIKLRSDGVITTPGDAFETSDAKEIDDLLAQGVFSFEVFDPIQHGGQRIFRSRMVREIKGVTSKPYEKSRLVIQGHSDEGKDTILTQSPTIQRVSQRMIVAIAASMLTEDTTLDLRDITQAYPQAQSTLKRTILAYLPKEMKGKYPENTIIRVIKPLYGIAEAGVHWFATYQGHHINKLDMSTSTYDPCLLIANGDKDSFGIVGMQTDDTLMLGTTKFAAKEEKEIQMAKFRTKPKTTLSIEHSLDFNGCTLTKEGETLGLKQKGQGAKIELIDVKATERAQRYTEQRARGAYIASICQPEAAFDLSVAAQAQDPKEEDYKKLNVRLEWQMKNIQRGLRFVPVDLSTAKLMVFTDGSFANNQDLSSQLGYILALVNETSGNNTFDIYGNIIHWSSTKCKRVTRSVLASEIYGMVSGFDLGLALTATLKMITDRLGLPAIPLIICTDSYSLYECLVKLGTTNEKRLMIDIMALRQSYERREITEIRWINGKDNPADAMTKSSPNHALQDFIDNNKLTIRIEGFVERP